MHPAQKLRAMSTSDLIARAQQLYARALHDRGVEVHEMKDLLDALDSSSPLWPDAELNLAGIKI